MDSIYKCARTSGMNYQEYLLWFEEEVKRIESIEGSLPLDPHDAFIPLNYQRTKRIGRTHVLSQDLISAVNSVSTRQLWMVITEVWCGDSAQNLPLIVKIAAGNSQLDVQCVLRDQNLRIMDEYLTEGSRAIPKLVAFDEAGKELFRWGPRPQEAIDLFLSEKAARTEKSLISEKLHLWYGKNRGQALEREFTELIKAGLKN